ncbi:MAG: type II secretion system F family protein [Desulfotomaculum sp.]|nr:type II secretion system F family protein [Desulfotomaculum sp.]
MYIKYSYRARDSSGRLVTGIIEAPDLLTAAELLRRANFYITGLEPADETVNIEPKNINVFFNNKVSTKELAVFSRQLSTLLEAGVPILTALDVISNHADKKFRNTVSLLIKKLQSGYDLAEAMQKFRGVFPALYIQMIKTGVKVGQLGKTLERLADYLEKEHEIKERVKSTLVYPAVILISSFFSLLAMMIFVLPNFIHMMKIFDVQLPLLTQLLFKVSNLLIEFWYLPVLLIFFVPAGLCFSRKNQHLKTLQDILLIKLPVIGIIHSKMIIARFSRSLSDLIKTGVPLVKALAVCRGVLGNSVYIQLIDKAGESLQRGGSIALALNKSSLIPPMVSQMIKIGEESGTLEYMLEKIADTYEREVEVSISRLSVLLEPVLIIFTGGIVALVVMGTVLPIFNIVGSVKY